MARDQSSVDSPMRQEDSDFSSTMRIDISPEAIREQTPKTGKLPRAKRPSVVPSTGQPSKDEWEGRYETLIDSVYDAMLVADMDGRIVKTNLRATEFLIFSRSELCRRNIIDVISGAKPSLLISLLPDLKNHRFALIQAYCIRKDGTVFPSEISVGFVDDSNTHLYFFIRDETVRKQREDRLIEQYNAIQHAASGIVMTDLQGILTYVNPAAANMWGYEQPSDLVGKDIMSLWSEAAKEEIKSIVDILISEKGSWNSDLTARRQDRTVFHVSVSINRNLDSDGVLTGLVLSLDDISDRIEVMNHLRELDETKSQFVAEASHELRTPLAIINEFVALVRDEVTGPINDRQKDCLESVLRNCDRLGTLINQMLDLARIEAGKVDLDRRKTDIASILTECHNNFLPVCQGKKQELLLTVPDKLPDVYCDVNSIHKILTNLVGNAVKFTPEGGTISIGCQREGKYLRIAVEDTGRGIPPEAQKTIFDAFSQIDRGAGAGAKGTGLGLAVAKKLVELNAGIISVDSAPGRGSCFSFTLPLYVQDAPAGRVLIVDDEQTIVELITHTLERSGLNLEVKSTLEGMESLLIAGHYNPNLVILDIKLKDVGGEEILSLLKQQQGSRSDFCKVLAISGDHNLLRALKAKGADDYLCKPFTSDALVKKVMTLLGNRVQRSSANLNA